MKISLHFFSVNKLFDYSKETLISDGSSPSMMACNEGDMSASSPRSIPMSVLNDDDNGSDNSDFPLFVLPNTRKPLCAKYCTNSWFRECVSNWSRKDASWGSKVDMVGRLEEEQTLAER